MSDLSIYELDDIIWDDLERNGDHIVPHPSDNYGSEDNGEGRNSKKPRPEVTPSQSNEGNIYAYGGVSQEIDTETLNKEMNMMQTDSWSHTPNGVFAATGDGDLAKDIPSIQSGDTKLCTDEGILKDTRGAVDSPSYSYPTSHITQSDNLNLFSNDGDGKESNDLLYYGWPDIGNFEDVDTMLSNCDSSFGLGVAGNDDELVWFTSEDPAGGYEAMKMDLKFPHSQPSGLSNLSQDHEPQEIGNRSLEHDSVGYMQSTYLHQAHDNAPMQTTGDLLITDIKSETKGPTSPCRTESSNAFQPSFSGNQKQTSVMFQASRSDMGSSKKQFSKENKIESQSDIDEIRKGASADLDSLNVREGSSISSELDEISLEASSFRQLQQVMQQLDLRAKLCIRDSLYRLATSAEQRHNFAGKCDSTTNCGATAGPLMTEGTNKYTGLMDMETDTNPIDRTIAHLLFHRPSNSSNRPTHVPLKPNVKVHGSTTGPSMVADKLSCQEVENESDDKISSTGKN